MLVVIDAGHGGKDIGAEGVTGLHESDVNLEIALEVKFQLEERGIDVVMSRYDDIYVSLDERVRIANNSGADYFISIHCNSFTSESANGTETYRYDGNDVGLAFASDVHRSLINAINLTDRGIKRGNFKVIRETTMPAILTEIAFLSNPKEESLLKSEEFIYDVAVGLAKGILKHFGIKYEEIDYLNMEEYDTISTWAEEGYEFITSNKLSDGTRPKDGLTREEFWTILKRYHNKFNK